MKFTRLIKLPISTKQEEKKKRPKVKKKYKLMGHIATFLASSIVFGFLILTPFGPQSVVAKILDESGFHKTSMVLDLYTGGNGYNLLTRLANIDTKNKTACTKIWELADKELDKFEAFSFKSSFDIKPVNPSYQDQYNAQLYFFNSTNLGDLEQRTRFDITINTDVDELTKSLGYTIEEVEGQGQTQFDLAAETIIIPEGLYFTSDKINIKSEEFTSENSLNWYEIKTDIKDEQKNGMKEIAKAVQNFLKNRPAEMLSNKTGEYTSQTLCSLVNDIKINKVDEFTFENKYDKHNFAARELVADISFDAGNIIRKESPEIIERIINDSNLKEFLKGEYNTAEDFTQGIEKLTDSSLGFPEAKEYERTVESILELIDQNLSKAELKAFFGTDTKKEDRINFKIEPVSIYINSANGGLLAYKGQIKITFGKNALTKISGNNQLLNDMLKDGLLVDYQFYDIRKNNRVKPLKLPEQTEPIDAFLKELQNLGILPEDEPEVIEEDPISEETDTTNTNNTGTETTEKV